MSRLHTLPKRLQAAPVKLKPLRGEGWRQGKEGSTQRGYGYRWQQYRLRYLAEHPLCVMCQAQGRVTAATVVDHITPHRGDERLMWEPTNHQALCKPHHDRDKQRMEHAER